MLLLVTALVILCSIATVTEARVLLKVGSGLTNSFPTLSAAWNVIPSSVPLTSNYVITLVDIRDEKFPTLFSNRWGSARFGITISSNLTNLVYPPTSVTILNCSFLTFKRIMFNSITYQGTGTESPSSPPSSPPPSWRPSSSPSPPPSPAPSPPLSLSPPDNQGGSQGLLVGDAGVGWWTDLNSPEKASVQQLSSFFLHQSVGQDLEDGAAAEGFKFEYVDKDSQRIAVGLNGGLFSASNGNGVGKINEWVAFATKHKSKLHLAIMKFGYADISDEKLAEVKTAYLAGVKRIKSFGLRVLHVTPPLVYNAPSDNAPKMRMRQWMIDTFVNNSTSTEGDVMFDLMDIESGGSEAERCTRGGSWEVCDRIRSRPGCSSKEQGVDAPSGQGHLCFSSAQRIAKAFLYAIRAAGSRA